MTFPVYDATLHMSRAERLAERSVHEKAGLHERALSNTAVASALRGGSMRVGAWDQGSNIG